MADSLSVLNQKIKNLDKTEEFQKINLPLGYLFSVNVFLTDGINVPITLVPVGSIQANILSNVTALGINNSLIEISLEIKLELQVIIPMQSQVIEVITKIPLSIDYIKGEIPKYYVKNGQQTIPIVDE